MPIRVWVPVGCTAPETSHPDDREHEAHDAGGDPDPGDDEQEDDPDDDECDSYADHRSRVPARSKWETSGLRQACRTTSRSSVISRIVYAGPSLVLPDPLTPP